MPFVMIEARKLIAFQALLALPQPMRPRPTLKRLAYDHRDALANLRECHGRCPFFFPDAFPAPGTTWPVTTVFDDGANPSNCALHNPLNRLRSCFSGGILQYDVPPWPPGPTLRARSPDRRWTDNSSTVFTGVLEQSFM